ncbi:MAG: hypothetical protein QM594_00415 [Niabella sp.]
MREVVIALYLLLNTSVVLAQTNAISSYTTFLKKQNQSAKEYILGLFDRYDIVIICERFHGEMTQYELLTDVISDKRFYGRVGNIFTEIGVSTLNPGLNTFMHTKDLHDDAIAQRIMLFQQNSSVWPGWFNKNYPFFLDKVYRLNNLIPEKYALSLYPSDLPFSWATADSSSMPELRLMIANRDSIIASQIISKFNEIKQANAKRKKALVIMNYRHAFDKVFLINNVALKNVAYFLFKEYGNRVANVLLNTVGPNNSGNAALLQDGKWDAAFDVVHKENIGFDFANTPFGKDTFDLWPYKTNYVYKDIFTGFAFYKPIEQHYMVEGFKIVDSDFKNELIRRINLISSLGGEFLKMLEMKKILETGSDISKHEETKKYFPLDSLIKERKQWVN